MVCDSLYTHSEVLLTFFISEGRRLRSTDFGKLDYVLGNLLVYVVKLMLAIFTEIETLSAVTYGLGRQDGVENDDKEFIHYTLGLQKLW